MNWNELLNDERPSGEKFSENEQLNLSPFERDYYTIVGNSYFRRLQKKTQVYTLDENDFIRNRLTHSLEVSSIAEMLGKRVAKRIISRNEENLPEDFAEKLSMVLRCAGLLHDIGNPPFGHSGEEYIRDFFENNPDLRQNLTEQMWLDFINYEGNAHNLRIITKLGQSSNPSDSRYGMDLTNAVIGSIIKYPVNSLDYTRREPNNENKIKRGKIGFYHAEQWILKRRDVGVLRKLGTLVEHDGQDTILRNPIMLLMEAADDIAYATADIEDAIKKGLIKITQFEELLPSNDRGVIDVQNELKTIRETAMLHVIDNFMTNYDAIMSGEYAGELVEGCVYNLNAFKRILGKIFTDRDNNNEYRYNSKNKIDGILQMLTKAVNRKRSGVDVEFRDYLLLNEMKQYLDKGDAEVRSKNWLSEEERRKEELYHDYLAVVDFVSGMTDSYVSIFMDSWNNRDYLEKKKNEYKSMYIERMTQINSFAMTRKILREIECVDNWDNLQLSIILKLYLNNYQISGALGYDQHAREIMINIANQYEQQGGTILSESEWQEIIEKLELN